MADVVWHSGYEVKVQLNRRDLGNPGIPGLLEEITQPVSQRDRELLKCYAVHRGEVCKSESEKGKAPWMSIGKKKCPGGRKLVASHLPMTHETPSGESDRHKAVKDHLAKAASRAGVPWKIEAPSRDWRVRNDILLDGPAGLVGCEPNFYPMSPETTRYRSRRMRDNDITPLWITNDPKAALIDRAPWARINDMPWREIADSSRLIVRGGVRHLEVWMCTRSAERTCPDKKSAYCGKPHWDWFIPALLHDREVPEASIGELAVGAATGEYRSLYVPKRSDARTGQFMWVPAADGQRWEREFGQASVTTETEPEPEERLVFSEDDYDPTCRSGEDRGFRNAPSARRDTGDSGGVYTSIGSPPPADTPAADPRPTDGSCSQWVGSELRYCREKQGIRRYQQGYRCVAHDVRALAGLPPLPETPGIPAYRKGARS